MSEIHTISTDNLNNKNTDKNKILSSFNVQKWNIIKEVIWNIVKWVDDIIELPIVTPTMHEISKLSINELITIDNKWVLKIESSDYFRDINSKELEKVLLERIEKIESNKWIQVKTIDISEFNKVEHKYLKEKLYNIIWNNFPLLEVSRLSEWSKVLDITFLWVKALNDNISKEFVDLFNGQVKKYFYNNFNKNTWWEWNYWRIIRDNYKHITFSMNSKKDISETIFWNIKNKRVLLENIFDNLDKKELNLALKEAKIKDLDKVKSTLLKNFDFWIWTTIVQKRNKSWDLTANDKLEAFYKAEIASRNKVDLGELWDNLEFSFDNIKLFAENALIKEKEVVSTFVWKKFTFNSTEFDIVVNWKINNILLRYIRKWENIWDEKLYKLVNEYITNLNDWFDFIAPFVEKSQLNDVNIIEKQIEVGIIDTNLIKDTYKNTLSIDALKIQSKWKEWLRIFIDIVDMWIMNLNDFRTLAWKIVSWELKSNNINELLSAWQTATNRFQNVVTSIKDTYPGSKISLWWDEIFIFIPWKTELETGVILSDITKKLRKEDLVWRISNSTNKNNKKIFDNLDNFTSINKFFEKKVENIINNNGNVKVKKEGRLDGIRTLKDIKSFSSINLNIDIHIQKYITENTSKFIVDLKESIDYNMTKAVLSWRKDRYIFAFKGFTVNVHKDTNNELIITIK